MSSAAASMGEADAGPAKKGRRKTLVLLGVAALLALVGAGLWFGGVLPGLLGMGPRPVSAASAGADAAQARPPVFADVPDLVANLNVGAHRSSFVRLHVRLELARAGDQATVSAAMPRLQDLFQTYLRETRPEELRGSAGTWRLREELIARANIAATPARIVDVLFTEMIVQ